MNRLGHLPRILVFDSGVGGLSILREIQERLPACELIYASDNAAFPYGTKPEEELVERVDHVLHQLLKTYAADIVVVACNTASTLALPHIRSHFNQPIVGVVPAIKPAAARSRSKVIGLLATPATVARPYTLALIKEYASNCRVISVGSSELVLMAEQKLRGINLDHEKLGTILSPFQQDDQLDTLVLACTHFPLLNTELQEVLSAGIELVDSGEAIARRVEYLLQEQFGMQQTEIMQSCATRTQNLAVFTGQTSEAALLQEPLRAFGINQVQYLGDF